MSHPGKIPSLDLLWSGDRTGCSNGLLTGHALYRVSPKGDPFVGLGSDHCTGPLEELVERIEGGGFPKGGLVVERGRRCP